MAAAEGRRLCADLRDAALAQLHRERELDTPIGLATLRDGTWQHPAGGSPGTAEVLSVDLREPTPMATVAMPGPNWTAYALQQGRVVAAGPAQTAPGQLILTAPAIDRVVVHAQHADALAGLRLRRHRAGGGWSHVADVQLPLREADPSLADERTSGTARAAGSSPGEDLDQPTFRELATRSARSSSGTAARFDRSTARSRPDPDSPDTILGALDPLKLALLDPVVRRALGLAYFDDDPALVLGETYQYRVSAKYPSDAERARPGFHTVPVGAQVPADFFLGDVRVRLSQPSRVELVPTGAVEDIVVGRRAIPVGPRESPHWLLPDLLDAALVLDFAAPRSAIVLQLADADLHYEALDADGGGVGGGDLSGTQDHSLSFSAPAARLILHGKGRWLGASGAARQCRAARRAHRPGHPRRALSPAAAALDRRPARGAEHAEHERPAAAQRARLRCHLAAGARPRRERVAGRPGGRAAARVDAVRARARAARRGVRARVRQGRRGLRRPRRQAARPLGPGSDVMLVFPENPPPPTGPTQDFTTRDHFLRDPEIAVPQPGTSTATASARSTRSAGRAGG